MKLLISCFFIMMFFLMFASHALKPDITVQHFTQFSPAICLQTGDVVLRESKGILSSFFKNCSQKEKKYSHAGFIVKKEGKVCVAHYIDDGASSGLKVESLNDFMNIGKCNSVGFYRFSLNKNQIIKLSQIIHSSVLHQLPFDEHFDLSTDNSYYCTEWISKSLFEATGLIVPVTEIAGMKYIAPDNIYMNSFCSKIGEIDNNKIH